MSEVERPSEILLRKDTFSDREVGITHPDLPSFIRLGDNGDIEIMAGEGIGIILHPQNKTVTIVADAVKFMTKDEHGLRWNKLSFNSQATKFTEPAFVPFENDDVNNLYHGTEDYLGVN